MSLLRSYRQLVIVFNKIRKTFIVNPQSSYLIADRTFELLAGAVDHLRQLGLLTGQITFVGGSQLPRGYRAYASTPSLKNS